LIAKWFLKYHLEPIAWTIFLYLSDKIQSSKGHNGCGGKHFHQKENSGKRGKKENGRSD